MSVCKFIEKFMVFLASLIKRKVLNHLIFFFIFLKNFGYFTLRSGPFFPRKFVVVVFVLVGALGLGLGHLGLKRQNIGFVHALHEQK